MNYVICILETKCSSKCYLLVQCIQYSSWGQQCNPFQQVTSTAWLINPFCLSQPKAKGTSQPRKQRVSITRVGQWFSEKNRPLTHWLCVDGVSGGTTVSVRLQSSPVSFEVPTHSPPGDWERCIREDEGCHWKAMVAMILLRPATDLKKNIHYPKGNDGK